MKEHIDDIKSALAVIRRALDAIDEADPEAGWFIENEVDTALCEVEEAVAHMEKTWAS